MSRPLRVLLVGRYFWPLGSFDSAGHTLELATGLDRAGVHVEVVTPKHANGWTDGYAFREYRVHRPVRLFKTGWTARADRSPSRYIADLRDWITEHSASPDVLFCNGIREEAVAVGDAARRLGVPSVMRMLGRGDSSDLEFFEQSRMGARCRKAAMDCDAVIIGDSDSHRAWLSSGGDAANTKRIATGIGPTADTSFAARSELRRSMARINGDLFVPDHATVVLSVERMTKGSGLNRFVEQAYRLSETVAGLQFWLIGDGPRRDSLFNQLRGAGLRQVTAMPGSFALMQDLFVAADMLVHFGDDGFDSQIPTAVSCGIPLVMANTPAARSFFEISDGDVTRAMATTEQEPSDRDGDDSVASLVNWFDASDVTTFCRAVAGVRRDQASAIGRSARLRGLLQRRGSKTDEYEHAIRLLRRVVDEYSDARRRGES